MSTVLETYLLERGATPDEIERAHDEGWLTLLAIDRLLLPGPARYGTEDLADRSGLPREVSIRVRRALGFPDVPEGQQVFTDEAVEMLRLLRARLDTWFTPPGPDQQRNAAENLVRQVRAISGGFGRVAEVLSDAVVDTIEQGRDAGLDEETIATIMVENFDWESVARLDDFALRLQVRAAVWRKLAGDDSSAATPTLAVGFVDLVGYTALSQELEDDELGALVTRFEELTHDTVAQLGGRIVKSIGDEVMFVAEAPDVAARIALRLTERTGDDQVLPNARGGLAYGSVVAREGDYYGPVVNLAHRLVEVAYPGTVLASDALHVAIADGGLFAWGRPRTRKIRDIGRVGTWPLRARESESAG